MVHLVEVAGRQQASILPAGVEDYVDADNPVRIVDAFVDELDLAGRRPTEISYISTPTTPLQNALYPIDFIDLRIIQSCPAAPDFSKHCDEQDLSGRWVGAGVLGRFRGGGPTADSMPNMPPCARKAGTAAGADAGPTLPTHQNTMRRHIVVLQLRWGSGFFAIIMGVPGDGRARHTHAPLRRAVAISGEAIAQIRCNCPPGIPVAPLVAAALPGERTSQRDLIPTKRKYGSCSCRQVYDDLGLAFYIHGGI